MRTSFSLLALSLPWLAAARRQVYLSRHCVRATDHDDSLSGYTSHPFVDWGVPRMWCTANGMDIMKKTGKDLVDSFGIDPAEVRFYSDPIMRDADTSFNLMMGMGVQHANVDYDLDLWQPHKSKVSPCKLKAFVGDERRARFDVVPMPWDYKTALAEMQEIIGVGPAGRLENLDGPDAGMIIGADGVPRGGVEIMKNFGQVMLYAYASDLPFLNATTEQVNKFIAWQFWYRSVVDMQSQVAARNAPLAHRILNDLKNGSGTPIYVGHDTNMDGIAALLGLRWDAPPYTPENAGGELLPTPPTSGLLFEYEDDTTADDAGTIKVTYVYRIFDNSGAHFKLNRSDIAQYASISEFEETLLSGLKKYDGAEECYNRFEGADTAVLV